MEDLTRIIRATVKEVIDLDNAMLNLTKVSSNTKESSSDKDTYNDNLIAIDMLRDITKMIEGIERSDVRNIKNALQNLKDHTVEFEEVFNYFLSTGLYN